MVPTNNKNSKNKKIPISLNNNTFNSHIITSPSIKTSLIDSKFYWSFNSKFLDYKDNKFSFHKDKGVDITDLEKKLRNNYSTIKWNSIINAKKGLLFHTGKVHYDKLTPKAKQTINAYKIRKKENIELDDEEFYKIDIDSKNHRLWGVLRFLENKKTNHRKPIIYVIWNDVDHEFYKSKNYTKY